VELWNQESYYQFLKKLTHVIFGLASQVTALWGKEDAGFDEIPNFRTFLEIVLIFARHPSLNVTHGSALIWLQLLKHDGIAKDPTFIHYIPSMIQTIGPKIIKIPYPKQRPTKLTLTPESFASLDYDSEDEYLVFVFRCRTDLLEIFRQSTLVCPLLTFSYCEQWLMQRLRLSGSEANTR
jgi:exportin-5